MNLLIEEEAKKLTDLKIEFVAKLTYTTNKKEIKKEISIPNCNIVGNILENIFFKTIKFKIPEIKEGPKQKPPDFFVIKNGKTYNYELKCFKKNPGFDISNYTSFLSQICCVNNKTFESKINTKYIIYKYEIKSNKIKILKCYFLSLWQIIGYTKNYGISIQSKRGLWYNIRPQSEKKWNKDNKTIVTFLESLLIS